MSEIALGHCPICERPATAAFRPFCSRRCADVDLGRWFSESYAVPVADEDDLVASEDGARSRRSAGQDGDG